jgi:hypothetical protein
MLILLVNSPLLLFALDHDLNIFLFFVILIIIFVFSFLLNLDGRLSR